MTSITDRKKLYNSLMDSTKELMNIIYGDEAKFIDAKEQHPIESMLIDSYDEVIMIPNAATLVSRLIGIRLPATGDRDTFLYKKVKEYLILEKQSGDNLVTQIGQSKFDRWILAPIIDIDEVSFNKANPDLKYIYRTDIFVEQYSKSLEKK